MNTSKKKIGLGIAIIVVVLILLVVLFPRLWSSDQTANQPAGQLDVMGEVVSVNTDQLAFDGPALLEVQTDAGETIVVSVPAAINQCASAGDIYDVFDLEPGDNVSVSGQLLETGQVNVCSGQDDYLRLISDSLPTADQPIDISSRTETDLADGAESPTVTVGLGESVAFGDVVVTPVQVPDDSRCPEGVDCIWQGQLIVAATVESNGVQENVDLLWGEPVKTKLGPTILLHSATAGPDYEFMLVVSK